MILVFCKPEYLKVISSLLLNSFTKKFGVLK